MMTEHDDEPVRGLPARLPAGEKILWQGAPDWRVLARDACHVRKVALYFAVLMLWRVAEGVNAGADAMAIAIDVGGLLPFAVASIGLLLGLARLAARTTLYTVTNRRVVMRIGVAISVSINIPFARIETVAMQPLHDGLGNIALALGDGERIAYLHLWPHARPWRVGRPQPLLRGIADAVAVAETLSRAISATMPASATQAAAGRTPVADSHESSPLATAA